LTLGCGSSDDENVSNSDAATDAAAEAETSAGCPTPQQGLPDAGGGCPQPGLVCQLGSLSCSVTATCNSSGQWEVDCGNVFPDGGTCC
jgi:hypothetical protein